MPDSIPCSDISSSLSKSLALNSATLSFVFSTHFFVISFVFSRPFFAFSFRSGDFSFTFSEAAFRASFVFSTHLCPIFLDLSQTFLATLVVLGNFSLTFFVAFSQDSFNLPLTFLVDDLRDSRYLRAFEGFLWASTAPAAAPATAVHAATFATVEVELSDFSQS